MPVGAINQPEAKSFQFIWAAAEEGRGQVGWGGGGEVGEMRWGDHLT